MEIILFIGGIISFFLIRNYILYPFFYRGTKIEGGMSFNRPFVIELSIVIFWCAVFLWLCYETFQIITEEGFWNGSVLSMGFPILFSFFYGFMVWWNKDCEIHILHDKI